MRLYLSAIVTAVPLILSSGVWGADFAKGQDAYNSGNYETAIMEWQPIAQEGDAGGQFGMGLLYANGFGVALDDDQAINWYLAAAEQGHAEAQCNLAVMHANGWGVPQSFDEAFKWYALSAEQGVTQAQSSLAKMYSLGYGVTEDNVQAYKWFTIASELGDSNASYKRDNLAAAMSPGEISEADDLASAWLEIYQDMPTTQ